MTITQRDPADELLPDEICECGHAKQFHHDGQGIWAKGCNQPLALEMGCPCRSFITRPADDKRLEDEIERLECRNLDLEKFLYFCSVQINDVGIAVPIVDMQHAITQGWRTHCTSGELKDGKPRQDYQDYGLGFIDGHLAGRSEAFAENQALEAKCDSLRQKVEELSDDVVIEKRKATEAYCQTLRWGQEMGEQRGRIFDKLWEFYRNQELLQYSFHNWFESEFANELKAEAESLTQDEGQED